MRADVPDSPPPRSSSFQSVLDAFLAQPGLPFAHVLSAERIAQVFAKHKALYGEHGIYNTAMMVWSFLGQVLRDGKEASCQAAVAQIVSFRLVLGEEPPTADTGDYCRARAKLSEAALHELTCEVGNEMESPPDRTPGCGKACTQNWSMASRSPCPTPSGTRLRILNRRVRIQAWDNRSLELLRFSRWRRLP